MLLPSQKPSSYSLLKFVYVTSQLRHPLVVEPLLRKILDRPCAPPGGGGYSAYERGGDARRFA